MAECECGRTKRSDLPACSRCRALDGEGQCQQDVIAELRVECGATVSRLAYLTGRPFNSVQRVLCKLEKSGLASRIRYSAADPDIWRLA